MSTINVRKRNNSIEPLDITKWQSQISNICKGIADVSQSMIEIKSQPQFYNNMSTKEIDEITLHAIVDLINVDINPDICHTNYQYVAGKQRLSMLRKDVYGQYDPLPLYDIVKRNVEVGLYTDELLNWYTEDEWKKIESFIDHTKDELYSYAAIEQLIEKYLIRNRTTKQVYETPQVRYIVAAATLFHMEDKGSRMKYIKEYYNAASDGIFTMATPVLAGLGTPTKQFSSCVLIKVGDSLDSIFASGQVMARYASRRAGIGLDVSRIRPLGSPIRNGEISHTGLLPFLKKLTSDLKCVNQGGTRASSATAYYQIWHSQFSDLISLKNNQGTEETRVRHIDYGVVLSSLFWKRFKNKENITFFDPNEVPDLYDAFYRDIDLFDKLYVKYEKRTDIRKMVMSAEEVFKSGILKERSDTSRIYILNIDLVQKHGSFNTKINPIYQSNLCCVDGSSNIDISYGNKNQTITVDEFNNDWVSGKFENEVVVKSFDGQRDIFKQVTNCALTHVTKLLTVIEYNVHGTMHQLLCTPDHQVFTLNREWVQAKDLLVDDFLLSENNTICPIVDLSVVEKETNVYDLTVDDTECFYANKVLVHNCEIVLPTVEFESIDDDSGRISLCTLASINWGAFRHPEEMRRACRIIVRSLDNILTYQDYASIQAEISTRQFRPLGVGITNLAYFLAKRNMKYGEPDALAEVKSFMEHQAYYLTEATIELAKERGACESSADLKYSQGTFPWERRTSAVNELTDFAPELNWELLREQVKQYGVRNATTIAIAPVESCQSWRNQLNFANGDRLNFHEMLEQHNIDWKEIESTCEPGTEIKLNKTIEIAGNDNIEVVDTVIYNGFKPLNTITFEDGTHMNFTDNHRLLVNRASNIDWAHVYDINDGEEVITSTGTMRVGTIVKHSHEDHTWDISTPSHTFLLPNNCVSHNSSVAVNSTNGMEMPLSLIQSKESKSGALVQVVPDYQKLKNKYQLMWDQTDCLPYLKTCAVLGVYTCQAMSVNTFYNPKFFENQKVPATVMAKNLMLATMWGIKSFYYNRVPKTSVKDIIDPVAMDDESSDEGECSACIL